MRGWSALLALAALLGALPVRAAGGPGRAYYEALGVGVRASQQDIRAAYKRLAVKLHPDKNPDKALQDEFIKISEAYETLKDPDKRRKYDLYGSQPTSYGRHYDTQSQSEYDDLYHNGLYANDLFVDNLNGNSYFNYLSEGFHFINFYSPFCPPCHKVSDHWKRLAENFKGLVKIAAVNCKLHNSFCYNNMRISSYPTLLFYQNAEDHEHVEYNGDRTYEALEKFVMSFIEREVRVPIDEFTPNAKDPIAYVIGDSWLHKHTVTRIALHLKGLVSVVKIHDEGLRKKLSKNGYTTVVLHTDGIFKHITSSEESEIIDVIINSFPAVRAINPEQLMKIRNVVRSEANGKPWAIYFSSGDKIDKHLVQKLLRKFPDIEFGEINCDKWAQLCLSLQVVEPPAWALMKVGGAYERAYVKSTFHDLSHFIGKARNMENLQTLSVSEFSRIIEGDAGIWVLIVAPYKMSWDHLVDPFTAAALNFKNVQFGVMVCTANSADYCNLVTASNPVIVVQNGTRRHIFKGRNNGKALIQFISILMDNSVIELSESKFYEVLDARSQVDTWVVAFFPEFCGQICDQLKYEWKIVARKMRPITYVKVGSLDCTGGNKRFCDQSNVNHPIIRVYPRANSVSYVSVMQNLGKAPYMLEWILDYIGDAAQRFTSQTFSKTVLTPAPTSPLSDATDGLPWLVYFHSPRCYHCYEMYADFFITGLMLKHSVNLGRVNCLEERDICNRENIMQYPSIKLYMRRSRDTGSTYSTEFELQSYETLVQEIKQHVATVEQRRLAQNFGKISLETATPGLQHDEF